MPRPLGKRLCMRCFIALELDDSIKDKLQTAQEFFQNLRGKIRWCSRNQMHLTLKFLGETKDDLVPKVIEAIKSASSEIPKFEFSVEGLGAFPPTGQPRVLWTGIKSDDNLIRLQKNIEEKILPLGFPKENRDFSPHLTLGRVKERIDVNAYRQVIAEKNQFKAGIQRTGKVILFSSQLKPTGAIYTPVKEIFLR